MTSSFRRNARLQARFLMAMTGMLAVQSPARGQEIIPPKVYTLSPGGVNMSDGSFTGSATDLVIGPLSLDRFNLDGLRDPNTMFFGTHISHNFDIYVKENIHHTPVILGDRYKPIVHMGTSASGVYMRPLGNNTVYPSSDDAASATLSYASSAYTYTTHDGTIYIFNPAVTVNGAPRHRSGSGRSLIQTDES